MTKPGYKTTEFWLTVAANVAGLAVASGAFPEDSPAFKLCGLGLMLLASMGYQVSRASVKKAGNGNGAPKP